MLFDVNFIGVKDGRFKGSLRIELPRWKAKKCMDSMDMEVLENMISIMNDMEIVRLGWKLYSNVVCKREYQKIDKHISKYLTNLIIWTQVVN